MIDNPDVSALQFILDGSRRERWESDLEPLLAEAAGSETSIDVLWGSIDESIAFIHTASWNEQPTALISFWGEPFTAETVGRESCTPRSTCLVSTAGDPQHGLAGI